MKNNKYYKIDVFEQKLTLKTLILPENVKLIGGHFKGKILKIIKVCYLK